MTLREKEKRENQRPRKAGSKNSESLKPGRLSGLCDQGKQKEISRKSGGRR